MMWRACGENGFRLGDFHLGQLGRLAPQGRRGRADARGDQAAGEAAQEAGIKPEPAQGQPGLPADAGYLDKAWYYLKQSGSWCADKASAAWNGLVDLIGSGWQVMTGYWDLGYKKATGMF